MNRAGRLVVVNYLPIQFPSFEVPRIPRKTRTASDPANTECYPFIVRLLESRGLMKATYLLNPGLLIRWRFQRPPTRARLLPYLFVGSESRQRDQNRL